MTGVTYELTGERFGRLVVIGEAGHQKAKRLWLCQCDCGGKAQPTTHNLRSGNTQSCGCWKREAAAGTLATHGMAYTREYGIWRGMIRRCTNPNCNAFKYYGARGITVCDRWLAGFENFYADMGASGPGLSIDRINNDGNYEPGNCRWATHKQQANNQRRSRQKKEEGQ